MTAGFPRFIGLMELPKRSLTTVTNPTETYSSDYSAARPFNEIPKLSTFKTLWDFTVDSKKKQRIDKARQ